MISGSELRKGVIIELDGKLYQVTEYQHIKMKRTALAKVKLRDVQAGHTVERSFQSDEKLVRARLDSRSYQYLYHDGDLYYFMDEENYEQVTISIEKLGDSVKYLKDSMSVMILSYQDEILEVELPITVELRVIETGPSFKGDTATAGNKPAEMETGIIIQVPMFINNDDVIKVDIRNGSYLERVN
ncbi:elongation factor P [Chloroflexota bacterium]